MTPEAEAKLNELAQRTHRRKDELLEEAVNCLVAYNEWFDRKIKNSLAAAERGETVPDEDVRASIEQRGRCCQGDDPNAGSGSVNTSSEPSPEDREEN